MSPTNEFMSNPTMQLPKRKRGRPSLEDQKLREEALRLMARKTDETPQQRITRIGERFNIMYELTKGAVAGRIRSLIVSGAPGVGKSYVIERLLESAKEKNSINYEIVRGIGTAINLYKLMYKFAGERDIILLDDADTVYDDEEAMMLLKAGLDTTKTRKISWLSESAALKAEDIPQSFIYTGSMIFITNKDFQWIIDYDKNKLTPHFQALMSRSIYLDLKLHTPDDLVAWIAYSVEKHGILIQRGLTKDQQTFAIGWLLSHYTQFRELSIRTMLHLADFMLTNPTNWESFARVTILR